jgi:hypothetical protein
LTEASVNFSMNGSVGETCPNADATDISCVNGINASLALTITGDSWPFTRASNADFGQNANRLGVFGWGATACVSDPGPPNPGVNCAAPEQAPQAVKGICQTPGGRQYPPISWNKIQYCAEESDSSTQYPQGQCLVQRQGGVSGGNIAMAFHGFLP